MIENDTDARHHATGRLAYHLWEQARRPAGQDAAFWKLAQLKMSAAGWRPPAPLPLGLSRSSSRPVE